MGRLKFYVDPPPRDKIEVDYLTVAGANIDDITRRDGTNSGVMWKFFRSLDAFDAAHTADILRMTRDVADRILVEIGQHQNKASLGRGRDY